MIKTSSLLFASLFVFLLMGLSDYSYACHKGGNDPKGCTPPPPPDDGTGGTGKMNMKLEITDPGDVRGLDKNNTENNLFDHTESKCVRVTQSGSGNLEFNAATGKNCSRGIELDLDVCFPNCTGFPPGAPVGIVRSDPYLWLNTVGPNMPGDLEENQTAYVNAGFFFAEENDPDNNWALCFHRGGGGCDGNGDPLKVTRMPDGPAGQVIYEMTTQVPNSSGESCVELDGTPRVCEGACLNIGGVDQGCYDVQFTITWEELP